jgi:hypothetical protein
LSVAALGNCITIALSGTDCPREAHVTEEAVSEYQYIAFRAIDGPVDKKNLAYMRRQSSRAEITPWSFTNEYHFGDFRGNAVEMLRRGYDVLLHYANFGIRSLHIRLPQGFPDCRAAKPYLDGGSIRFLKDRQGKGGVLAIEPSYEPGDQEELWDLSRILDRLTPLRAEILEGDLRPLYLAHLAVSCDSEHDPGETNEAPPPAGLDQLTEAQQELATFHEISDALIAAAARDCPPMPSNVDVRTQYVEWLRGQSEATKEAWLVEMIGDAKSKLRTEILAEFRMDRPRQAWPTAQRDRTIAQLQAVAEEIQRARDKKVASEAARKRAIKLAKMAADPAPYFQKTERLVAERTTEAYQRVGQLLADLREALAETDQAGLAERQAQKLKKMNPTLRHLTAALRRQGFVPK